MSKLTESLDALRLEVRNSNLNKDAENKILAKVDEAIKIAGKVTEPAKVKAPAPVKKAPVKKLSAPVKKGSRR